MANGQYVNGNNEQYKEVPSGGGSELPAGVILMSYRTKIHPQLNSCRTSL